MIFRNVLICGVAITGIIFNGCVKEKAYPELSSPENTVRTYLRFSASLGQSVDTAAFRKTLSCFTKQDRDWYEASFRTLKFDKENRIYVSGNLLQQKAFVFGEVVQYWGPKGSNSNLSVREISETEARVLVDGFGEEIPVIKEGLNWRIKGFWGLDKGGIIYH